MKKFSYFYEIPILFVLLCVANYIFVPEHPGFIEINPNPYWLAVLLFGFRYGIAAGGTAGLSAALLYMALNWYFGESYLFEDTSFYLLPSLFIILGALIGLGVQRYHVRNLELKLLSANLNEKINSQEKELVAQRTINLELEKKIVSKMTTLITVHEGARNLESNSSNDILKTCITFFAKTLDASAVAIYKAADSGWELWQHTLDPHSPPSVRFEMNQGLVGQCAGKGKILSIKDFQSGKDNHLLSLDPLIAGPLRSGEAGPIVAIFAVYKIPLLSLNSSTINLFSFLLGWAGRSLGRAAIFEELQSQEILDPELNIYSYRYFETRLKQEYLRSRTYYLPMTVLLVAVRGLDAVSVSEKHSIMLVLSELLRNTCRETDVISRYIENVIPFSCLLTTTSLSQAGLVKTKIEENFKALKLSPSIVLSVGLASFTPQTKAVENLVEQAREELKIA